RRARRRSPRRDPESRHRGARCRGRRRRRPRARDAAPWRGRCCAGAPRRSRGRSCCRFLTGPCAALASVAWPGKRICSIRPCTGGRDLACGRRASMLARRILLTLAVLAAAPPLADAKRSYTVKVPTFEVPAGKNREICVFVPIRSKDALDLGEIRIANRVADRG